MARTEYDITPIRQIDASLAPMWRQHDPHDVTITDGQWNHWVEYWNRLNPEVRQFQAKLCRLSRHEYVSIRSGGKVCRRCCAYLRKDD